MLKGRIAFAGTPRFAVPTLRAIVESGAEVPLVLTQPDRRAGRGRRLTASPVKETALELGLKVEQPARLDDASILEAFPAAPDLLVVAAYGLILPGWMLDWARRGAVNVHASLLPRWRGAAPIQRALLAGDSETGISIMKMDSGLDTGPVYAMAAIEIAPEATAGTLHEELARLGADTLSRLLPGILDGSLRPEAQEPDGACYAPKLSKDEAGLDWGEDAAAIERKIRALNPWPVAESRLSDGRRLRIWEAELVHVETSTTPGTVIEVDDRGIVVAAAQGAVRLLRVQAPSARAMDAPSYLAAHPLAGASFAGST